MVAELSNWADVVHSFVASVQNAPAKLWICQTYGRQGPREVKIFTPEQYEATCIEGKSPWEKLSHSDILAVSYECLHKAQAVASLELERFVLNRPVDEEFEGEIKRRIIAIKPDTQKLFASLQTLFAQYASTPTTDETQKMRKYFDYVVRLVAEGQPELCKMVCDTIKDRIITNMKWFEEAIRYNGTETQPSAVSVSGKQVSERFATPQDVETKWIACFGVSSGKEFASIPTHAKLAVESRTRISALVQIWKNLLDDQVSVTQR